ncbi:MULTISPECIES: helix-turn-helix domain-containing protein [unclassified Adlercreutzia]|uniref:helix-turn-helix domain-containing protein n=1 Tax=unclassified Adlercreutzia TaxID=2636013 RepID=UPI0013E9D504|nr:MULTISPECIES: helix-turn-helix domain-containing protein [unclassified Adlercreutzia]
MRIVNASDFGAAIRKRRKELGYTQAELASYCGCSAVYLSNLENGKETAEIGKALFIVGRLGLDLFAMKRTGEPL